LIDQAVLLDLQSSEAFTALGNWYQPAGDIEKAFQAYEQEKAQALIDELMSVVNANPSVTYHDSAIHEASLYALSGQAEAAIATLEK